MSSELDLIHDIKAAYKKLKKKGEFIRTIAEKLNRKPTYLRNHWFGNYWAIPKKHHTRVLEELYLQLAFDRLEAKDK